MVRLQAASHFLDKFLDINARISLQQGNRDGIVHELLVAQQPRAFPASRIQGLDLVCDLEAVQLAVPGDERVPKQVGASR